MGILYISYDGMTDPLGQSQVIPYLTGLSKKGYCISIISCEKADKYNKLKFFIQELLLKNNIHWYPVIYSSLPSMLSKQLNLLRIKQQAVAICKANHPTIVHCRSYMAALIGLQLKQKFGIKFIFDMRGFWADERIDGKIWNLKNKIHKRIYIYFKKKEVEFLSKADYTISLTKNAKEEILSWKPFISQPIPIEVIPCCADLELFSTKNTSINQKKQLSKNLNIQEHDFILSYLGSIGTWYMLDEMLDFFNCLLKTKSSAKFLFICPDDPNEILKKAALKNIPTNKIIIYAANRKEVPLYLSLSHLSIYFIKPLYSKKASSPTKTAEILGMGIPIITNTGIGDSDEILTKSNAGVLINEFKEEEYIRIINRIDILLNYDKEKIVQQAFNYFSLEKGINLYQTVYNTIISNT